MFDLGKLKYTVDIDSEKAQAQLKETDNKLKSLGTSATKIGKSLTKSVTLPLLALGAAAIKVAADFEVASRKFNTAFKGEADAANAAVKNLSDNFGLASSQATQLLANTGDILKGFGATSKEALNLSDNVQQLAAQLSAYNGIPVKQASEAITKALTGEREGMKALGVVISESAVQQQLLLDGTAELTGEQLLLAKAQATVTLAMSQSGDAIASFSENQGTLAFQTQALLADIKDLGVEIGTLLLPVIKDIVGGVREGIEWFSGLDDTIKKTILVMAGIAAAAGPVIAAIGAISTALTVLSANPVLLVAAAVAILTTAIVKNVIEAKKMADEQQALVDATDDLKQNLPVLVEEYNKLRENTNKTNEETARQIELEEQIKALLPEVTDAILNNKDALLEEAIAQQEANKQKLEGIILDTKKTLEAETQARDDSIAKLREQIQGQYELTNALYQTELQQAQFADRVAKAESFEDFNALAQEVAQNIEVVGFRFSEASENIERLTPLLADAESELARVNEETIGAAESIEVLDAAMDDNAGTVNEWNTAWQTYNETVATTARSREAGYITEREAIEENIATTESYIETLIKLGAGGEATAGSWGNTEIEELLILLEDLKGQLEDTRDTSEEVAAFEKEWADKRLDQTSTRLQQLDAEEAATIAQAEAIGAETLSIEEYYAEERKLLREEEQENKIEMAMEYAELAVGFALELANAIADYQQNIRDQELQDLERQFEVESVARQNAANAQIKQLDKDLANGLITRAEYDEKIEALRIKNGKAEEEAAWALTEAKYEADLAAFENKKELAYAEIWINVAMGIAKAWADNQWVMALIVSGLVLASGIAQTAVVASQPAPPKPVKPATKFADGGMVNNPGAGVNAIVGEAGPEAILPLTDETFGALGEAIVGAQAGDTDDGSGAIGGGMTLNLIIEGMGEMTIPVTQEAFNNNQIRVPASALVS